MIDRVKHALYRVYDCDNSLLYVGVSMSPLVRANSHALTQVWQLSISKIMVEWHSDKATAEAAEKVAIETENPTYNIKHKPKSKLVRVKSIYKSGVDLDNPETWFADDCRQSEAGEDNGKVDLNAWGSQ